MSPEKQQIIKKFAVEILGCGCPDKVFQTIDDEIITFPFVKNLVIQRIVIGNRLLIYLFPCPAIEGAIRSLPQLIEEGTAERDRQNYNRFRLVVYGVDNDARTLQLQSCCKIFTDSDDRLFLHVLDHKQVRELLPHTAV